jgi:hypothetical protein
LGAEFPPVSAQRSSVGDKDYSPLLRVLNDGGTIYNAPIVARECLQERDDLVFLFIRQAEHTRRSVKGG